MRNGHWNYRVLQSYDGKEFLIAEVFYDREGQVRGWYEADGALKWDDLDDLRGTVEKVREAFNKPMMRIVEGDRLVEL